MVVIPTRRHSTRGAAAVEFALVFPLLAVIMFGVIQYGLYFYDAHGTRTGVREAARMGVVQTDITGTCNNLSYLVELKCETKAAGRCRHRSDRGPGRGRRHARPCGSGARLFVVS